jgi:hypothetical protein
MEDQLNIYFKKARESLSEPASIDEVRNKLKDAPAVKTKPAGVPRQLKIFLGVVVLLGGLYFLVDFGNPNEEATVDNKAAPKEAIAAEEPRDAPLEEDGTLMQEDTKTPDVTTQPGQAPDDQPIQPRQQSGKSNDSDPENAAASTDPVGEEEKPTTDTGSDPVNEPAPEPESEPEARTEPEAAIPSSSTAPAIRDQANGEGGHRFEILSTSTSKDLRELNKTLSQYGIKMHIGTIEYDREWISRLNGHFEDLSTGRKSKFNIGSINF